MKYSFQKQLTVGAIVAVAAIFSASGEVRADLVTYYTTGPASTNFDLNRHNTIQVSYAAAGSSSTPITVSAPGYGSLGTFTWTDLGRVDGTNPSSAAFDLKVYQTVPTVGNGTFIGDLTGTVSEEEDSNHKPIISLTFANTSISIGGATYQLELKNGSSYSVVAKNTPITLSGPSGSGTTLYAYITTPNGLISSPEPSTFAMAFSGAVLMAGAWWRKRTA